MARPIWSGAINFGLVSVPVRLYSATHDHTVHFHQIQRGTSSRVRNRRVNEKTGKEVDREDIVKGFEVDDGEYVVVEPDELDDIAPGRSRTLDVVTFVDLDEIDPVYFQKTYWLAPGKDSDPKPYGLLVKAMAKTNRAGIGTFVMRGKEYLAAIRATDGLLALETLSFADEVVDPKQELSGLSDIPAARGKQLDMAVSLVESMSGGWDPSDYRDTYTERVNQLIKDKQQGKEPTIQEVAPEPTNVTDLVDVLRQSIEQAKSTKGTRKGSAKGGAQRRQADPDLGELTKAELDAMARDLGVSGRSKMKRADLEKAITSAGKSEARSKAS